MALKPTTLMSYSVALTLSTRRINLDGNSHSFSLSFTLFTFLDWQESSHVSLSSGKTQLATLLPASLPELTQSAISLILSLAGCFAQRITLPFGTRLGWLITAADTTLVSKWIAHTINLNGESWCWQALFITLFCPSFTCFARENFLNYSERVDIGFYGVETLSTRSYCKFENGMLAMLWTCIKIKVSYSLHTN